MDWTLWESRFEAFLRGRGVHDASHGLDHIRRVVVSAKRIGEVERACSQVIIPAAWLHDCVALEKDAPNRSEASTLAADTAQAFLLESRYPDVWLSDIHHAIRAHSFSARIPPETLEAKVVQDADRLDALGAVGLARCFMVGSRLGLPFYDPRDPFCRERSPNDRRYILDHFFTKLLRLPDTMQTEAGRTEARRRVRLLETFLNQLKTELPAD